jgi:two-component system, chemotaxis family, chemotaxis protein CheY
MLALVVDDSRTVRIIVSTILREIGMTVIEAADGQQALALVNENPDIELALVDWNMPEMNGLDFIKAVRAEPAYNGLRILMVTSETEVDQVTRALNAGANEYLMKPFTREILLAKLNLMDVLEE